MANNTKKKSEYINMLTPVAPLMYINLHKADPKYDKYGVTIVLDRDNSDHLAFIEELEAMNHKAYDELIGSVTSQRKSYKAKELREQEDEHGEETGCVLLKCITTKQPPCFDAALPKPNRLGADDLRGLWSGTEARCKLSLKASVVSTNKTIGYTVYLSAVQLVNPKYGAEDSSSFEGIDGGFSSTSGSSGAVDDPNAEAPEGANF